MKKWLAVLMTAVLLLGCVPAAASVGAESFFENLLISGDFEQSYCYDWDYYQNSYPCEEAAFDGEKGAYLQGNGGWGALIEQTVEVTLGKTYHLEFWYKVINNGFNWRLVQGGGEGLYATAWETADEWTYVSYDFVASSEWVTINFCGSGNGIVERVFVDDVVICPVDVWEADGTVINGDFENNQFLGWSVYQDTHLSSFAAADGEHGAFLQGDGGWGALLEQGVFTRAGGEYELSFRYKVMSNGFNLQVIDGQTNERLAGGWYTDTEWTEQTVTFVAASTATRLNFCGGGNGICETVFIDDVVLTYVGEDDPTYPDVPIFPDLEIGEIEAGETQEITVSEELGMSFLLFTPVESGWYAVSSAGEYNTYLIVVDESGENAVFNDNDGDADNFRAVIYCEADTPYLMMLALEEGVGTFDVTVDAVETQALFPAVTSIGYGDTVAVVTEQTGVSQVLSFIPEESGTYILTAAGEEDTYCFLYDVDGEIVQMFDDEFAEEDNYNFVAAYDCTAGNTYYFVVSSYAEEAASFIVTLTAEEQPPTPPEVLYGDLNGDGDVDNRDLGLFQQFLNFWGVSVEVKACDVDADGYVNNRDLALLQQYLNGWDVDWR